jgi:UDP-glucuronate decarboxylase
MQNQILLTGATGFVGRSLLRYYKSMGENSPKVIAISRNPERFWSAYPELKKAAKWISADILIPESLPKHLPCTHIIHAAADSITRPESSVLDHYDQIVLGTRNMLESAIASGAKRFLFVSSGAVYGPQPLHIKTISESYCGMPDPLDSRNVYGVSKRTAEHLCALYAEKYDIDTIVARCFAFVGQDLPLDKHFAIGNFIRDALYRDEITVSGDGKEVRSYLDQSDLAVWLMVLLEKGKSGYPYNVGSDQPITILDLAQLVRDTISPKKKVHVSGKHSSTDRDRSCYLPDITRAREEFGLKVTVSLPDAIFNTALAHQ